MNQAAIDHIMELINQLDDAERVEFRMRLARQLDDEWERETRLAREEADRRGIDMDAIDRAVERVRYG